MNKRLYRLLMEYNNRELDDRFIDVAFDTIMSHEDEELYKYVEDFSIDNSIKDYGTYDHNNHIVTINRAKIIHDKPVVRNYNDRIFALEVVKHEIEHAKNIKKLYEGREDIESTIIRYSLKDFCMTHGLLPFPMEDSMEALIRMFKRNENYIYNPEERMVDIKAWKFMVNLLKNQRTSDDLLFARSMLYYAYIRGYEDNRYYMDAPTYSYLLNTDMFREFYLLKKRVDQKDYCFDTRLLYGLPITYDEYDNKILKKTRLQKRKDGRRLERE